MADRRRTQTRARRAERAPARGARRPHGRRPPARRAAPARHARRPARPTPRAPASPRVTRRRRLLLGVLAALALVGFLFAFVYPTRTYLGQREQIRRAEERLTVLRRQTEALERDTKRL